MPPEAEVAPSPLMFRLLLRPNRSCGCRNGSSACRQCAGRDLDHWRRVVLLDHVRAHQGHGCARIPVIEILFVRQIVLSIIVWPVIAPDLRGAFTTGNFKLHMLRIALALVAMIAGFTSTVHLPLADVTALAFTKSIFVTLFAIILLREKVGLHRWGATLLGFAGVGLMLKPSGDGSLYYGLLAILSAAAAGLIMVIIRKLAQNEKLSTIMAYQSFGVGAVLLVPTIWLWVTPTWFEALLMLLVGVTSAVGQSMNILGYRAGEAAMVAPMDYLRLIYASAIGILIFNDWPTLQTLAGAAIIVARRRSTRCGAR